MSYINNSQDSEEIVSDTFMALWNNRKQLSSVENIESYLYGIARNKIMSYIRASYSPKQHKTVPFINLFNETETTPESLLISKQEIEKINGVINSLPDKCKEVFMLVRIEKIKYKEVATILGISEKTVDAHVTTAVKKIREILSQKK